MHATLYFAYSFLRLSSVVSRLSAVSRLPICLSRLSYSPFSELGFSRNEVRDPFDIEMSTLSLPTFSLKFYFICPRLFMLFAAQGRRGVFKDVCQAKTTFLSLICGITLSKLHTTFKSSSPSLLSFFPFAFPFGKFHAMGGKGG